MALQYCVHPVESAPADPLSTVDDKNFNFDP